MVDQLGNELPVFDEAVKLVEPARREEQIGDLAAPMRPDDNARIRRERSACARR
jgi:hypothetical protein